jgi:hypothetical protein
LLERETQRGAAREHVMKAKALFVLTLLGLAIYDARDHPRSRNSDLSLVP